jgi:hypothetical protein
MPAPSRRRTILRVCAISFVALVALLYLFAGVLIGDPSPEDRAKARAAGKAAPAPAPTSVEERFPPPAHLLLLVAKGDPALDREDVVERVFGVPAGDAVPPDVSPRGGWINPGVALAPRSALSKLPGDGSTGLPLRLERERDLEFVGEARIAKEPDRGETLAREALRDLFCARMENRLPGERGGKMACSSVSSPGEGVYEMNGLHRQPAGAPPPAPIDPAANPHRAILAEPTWTLRVAFEGEEWAGLYYRYRVGPRNAGALLGMMRRVGDRWILVMWEWTWMA